MEHTILHKPPLVTNPLNWGGYSLFDFTYSMKTLLRYIKSIRKLKPKFMEKESIRIEQIKGHYGRAFMIEAPKTKSWKPPE